MIDILNVHFTMMRIAINCWILRNKQPDGIGYFTINTIPLLIKQHPEVEFLVLCDKNFSENYFDFPNAKLCKIFPPYRHPLLYMYYLEFVVPRFLKKSKTDLFLSTDGFLSLNSNCPQVPVMHDINFVHNPENMDLKNKLYYNYFFKKFVAKASRILAISNYTKADLIKTFDTPEEKIDVMYISPGSRFSPISSDEKELTRTNYAEGKPYFFFVGTLLPRKNLQRLILAFDDFKAKTGSDLKLVLAGSILWKASELEKVYTNSEYKSDIVFTGRVSDNELNNLFAAAFALCFVSLFEGFGLPVIEAMHCETPVICSNVSSLPEVGGEAVLYVDPHDISSISSAMVNLVNQPELREALVQKGNLQKLKFSVEHTTRVMWNCLQKVYDCEV